MLERLSPNEQRVLMELLVYMARADGQVADAEREVLHQYADLVRVDFDEIDGDLSPEELVPHFTSPESRVIVLAELFRLSHLDGLFSDGEQSAILEIASLMGVPMMLLREIEQWVVEGLQWVWRGEEILEQAVHQIHDVD